MDTYRVHTQTLEPSKIRKLIQLPFAQRSQRYQKIILKTPNSSVSIASLGCTHIRPPNPTVNTFSCSNEKLNKIWMDGVRTVDMCTVEAGETTEAWEVTEEGTRILGQHWAPCRHGTRWGDATVDFEVKIEKGGASWGVHMVANGLIFCLDTAERSLAAFEGLSDTNGVFPSIPRGQWAISEELDLEDWISVKTITKGSSVSVQLNRIEISTIENLDIHPILGGSGNNTGSVAFGGPQGYISVFRSLQVTGFAGQILYRNNFLLEDKSRTFTDFAVGTNALACTVDGAKRDRALFGGDLFVMCRSICYSTANMDAILGSIKLLTSHQTEDGYLGNLCPIQAQVYTDTEEPPTYAFYSLSYALLLVVAIKDYWMHSGDVAIIQSVWTRLEKLIAFTDRFTDARGLVMAPPPLSSKRFILTPSSPKLTISVDWFPIGGPIYGASGKINLAFYDALRSMSKMCSALDIKETFSARADLLKDSLLSHLWNGEAGIMRMSDISSETGICQDINAYAITTGVAPPHSKSTATLAAPKGSTLPRAFLGIDRWDQKRIVSPYASGFAAEALFERSCGGEAIELLERIWGIMADGTNPNYSGGHWEALKPDGTPITDDTSLMHGWSTWPVYLLPRYLGGVQPLEAGWSSFMVKPVLASLDTVDVQLSTPAGKIGVHLDIQESLGAGDIKVTVPLGSHAKVFAPEGWIIVHSEENAGLDSLSQDIVGKEAEVSIRIRLVSEDLEASDSTPSERRKPSKKSVTFFNAEETENISVCGDKKFHRSSLKRPNILKRLHRWLT